MGIKRFTSDSKMDRGVNKNYTLKQIYQFMPGQIDWAMKVWDNFYVDIGSFKELLYTPVDWFTLYSRLYKEIEKEARLKYIQKRSSMLTNDQIDQKVGAIIDPLNLRYINNSIAYSLYFVERFKPNLVGQEFFFSKEAIQKNKEKYWLYIDEQEQKNYNSSDYLSDEEYGRLLSQREGYYSGWSKDEIDDAFEGDIEATWNVD